MKLFKIFQFAYLVFALLFLYDAITNWGESRAYASLLLGVLAVFMFFFRRKFNNKFDKNR
ncbi:MULTISPECIES: hypothetical protein [Mesoflavibacter]|uniref:LPXTG cell wall anchor domain-containing protein n=1 Tax=Mesoflavibacter profundi TaxID=2708110 RepID=A0ABT4S0H3_9FLAO|nr:MULTISPECIES: hypothetical protein [Mesoflavibacter]MDA0177562.1 hypothetical protein [Mesoflavibacter profundi]QIJ88517.1 hypothetical protein C7H62_0708 [Mesoflavibacter sp. HG96]QIJ91245.1 hypothetical protein C7H56_0708 [Mesoflavibacter sp. HG37]